MTDMLFDLSHTIAGDLLGSDILPYRALPALKSFIEGLLPALGAGYSRIAEGVYAHETSSISPNAVIMPPAVIQENAEIRTGAFIRGSVIIGRGAVIGNSVEVKNSIIFDEAEIPHLSYIGDSIIGYRAHFGAGAMTSNLRSDRKPVIIRTGEERISTGLLKLGALVGDYAEIGCNSVLNPGTVIGRHAAVYPLSSVRGYVPPLSIFKNDGTITEKKV